MNITKLEVISEMEENCYRTHAFLFRMLNSLTQNFSYHLNSSSLFQVLLWLKKKKSFSVCSGPTNIKLQGNISVWTYIDPNVRVLRVYNLDGRHRWVQVVLYIVYVGWRFCEVIYREKHQLQSLLSSVQKLHPNAVIEHALTLQKLTHTCMCSHCL